MKKTWCALTLGLMVGCTDIVEFPDPFSTTLVTEAAPLRQEGGTKRCTVSTDRYRWVPCEASSGMIFEWVDPDAVSRDQLQGWRLELSYPTVSRPWNVR